MKIGLMADGELENISVPNNKKTKFGLNYPLGLYQVQNELQPLGEDVGQI